MSLLGSNRLFVIIWSRTGSSSLKRWLKYFSRLFMMLFYIIPHRSIGWFLYFRFVYLFIRYFSSSYEIWNSSIGSSSLSCRTHIILKMCEVSFIWCATCTWFCISSSWRSGTTSDFVDKIVIKIHSIFPSYLSTDRECGCKLSESRFLDTLLSAYKLIIWVCE